MTGNASSTGKTSDVRRPLVIAPGPARLPLSPAPAPAPRGRTASQSHVSVRSAERRVGRRGHSLSLPGRFVLPAQCPSQRAHEAPAGNRRPPPHPSPECPPCPCRLIGPPPRPWGPAVQAARPLPGPDPCARRLPPPPARPSSASASQSRSHCGAGARPISSTFSWGRRTGSEPGLLASETPRVNPDLTPPGVGPQPRNRASASFCRRLSPEPACGLRPESNPFSEDLGVYGPPEATAPEEGGEQSHRILFWKSRWEGRGRGWVSPGAGTVPQSCQPGAEGGKPVVAVC